MTPNHTRTVGWVLLALVGVTLAVHVRACGNGFVEWDDPDYVTKNPHVLGGLTWANAGWAFTTTHAANWHPLTWLSLQLDAQLFGPAAWGFHLTNVLLHAANVGLLFAALRRLTGATGRSAAVAAFFGLHPLHVESVAWVTERKDVLSTLFGFLALLAYAAYAGRPGWWRYGGVVAAFALSLLAKPMLVTLPCLLLLLDGWPLRRFRAGALPRLLLEKLPLLALAAASCAATVLAQEKALVPLDRMPVGVRFGNSLVAYCAYAWQTVWPTDLIAFYPHPRADLRLWQKAGAALALLAATATALAQARRRPYLAVGWLWYLGMLVPVIGLVQVGMQARADRYTYVPLVGLFVLAVWGAADLTAGRRTWRFALASLTAALLLACAGRSWVQIGTWRDTATLWEHAAAVRPGHRMALANLAGHYLKQRRPAEARRCLEALLRLDPGDAAVHNSLGVACGVQGLLAEAQAYFRSAVRLSPGYAEAHANLGWNLERQGRPDEALAHYALALRHDPDHASARSHVAGQLRRRGRPDAAVAHFAAAAARARPEKGLAKPPARPQAMPR